MCSNMARLVCHVKQASLTFLWGAEAFLSQKIALAQPTAETTNVQGF